MSRTEPGHTVRVEKGTLLHRICGADELSVNSAHHQAVKTVGPGVVVDAIAPDGVIEGIEDPRYRYCLGVQWHPEYSISVGDAEDLRCLHRRRALRARRSLSGAGRTPAGGPQTGERIAKRIARAGPLLAPRGGGLDRCGPRHRRRQEADQPGASSSARPSIILVDGKPLPGAEPRASLPLSQARWPLDHATRTRGAGDHLRKTARRSAAGDAGRPARSACRRPAAADQ